MKAPKFKDFITEDKNSKNFLRLLIITDEPDKAKEFKTADRLQEECKKLGYPYYLFKLTGGYTTNEDGIRKFHNKDEQGMCIFSNGKMSIKNNRFVFR